MTNIVFISGIFDTSDDKEGDDKTSCIGNSAPIMSQIYLETLF